MTVISGHLPPEPPSRSSRIQKLPPPGPFAEKIALAAVEILHGYRPARQLQEYFEPALYIDFVKAAGLNARCGLSPRLPGRVMSSRTCLPATGVCEATIVVHDTLKPRACAVRLESRRNKWRVTALAVG